MKPNTTLLPTPYLVQPPQSTIALDPAGIGNGSWPAANRAIYIPFSLPVSRLLSAIAAYSNGSTGNYDLGLYDETLTTRLDSLGSTAISAAGLKTWTLTSPILLEAGKRYYAAMSNSSTNSWVRWDTFLGAIKGGGIYQQTTAHPVPASATPEVAASAYIPCLTLTFAR